MKRVTVLFLGLMLIFMVGLTGYKITDNEGKVRVANTNLYADQYVDYAKEVFFDVEKNPDMAEMGLFWTKWDEETKSIIQIAADSEEGAALVDPTKPTIINVHGVLMNGHLGQEKYNLNSKVANPAEFDLDTNYVPMNYLWLREGWNVANFHYNRFASEGIFPHIIEYKIWTNDSEWGVRYRHADGTFSDKDVTQYTIAEHFAAEYIRAMQLLPKEMGQKEIRVAAHSMGGQVSTATLFLLTELADDGQLPFSQLPDRFALLDPYFSSTIELVGKTNYLGPKNANIRWSGKPIVENHVGKMMIECLKDIAANNIVIEHYTYENVIKSGMDFLVPELIKLSSYVILVPDYEGDGYTLMSDGHNGVREWYLCSLLNGPIKDITNGSNSGEFAPSASLPTEEIAKLKNKEFLQVAGFSTVRTEDDAMALKYDITYVYNGGTVVPDNPKYYSSHCNEIILLPSTRKNYTFEGWYLNEDLSGEKITAIDRSAKKKITLYAKWKAN